MNIVLLTNTFTPHVGGVARSVQAFAEQYRKLGHRVLIIAPEFQGMPKAETDVVRIPAIQNFNASDFSVVLPVPKGLREILERFRPDIIHSQHPFLLGMTAVRIARSLNLPLVFTHHTLYEQYTHYVPGDSPLLKRFVIELATRYANLSNQVFAPSESIRQLLVRRGVKSPIAVIPTGVRLEQFTGGDRAGFRKRHGIPRNAFVVGHMGRLAPEKNLEFLTDAAVAFIRGNPDARFLLVGSGPSQRVIREIFANAGIQDRLVLSGTLEGRDLADALGAMDVFAFASKSETQGMVLTEAMAAGLPVVALDASGVREVVRDGENGRLVTEENIEAFRDALIWVRDRPEPEGDKLIAGARATADEYSMARSAEKALGRYATLQAQEHREEEKGWEHVMARIKVEWDIIKNITAAGDDALSDTAHDRGRDRPER